MDKKEAIKLIKKALLEGKLNEAYDQDVPNKEKKDFESMCGAMINHIKDIQKGVKSGKYTDSGVGNSNWEKAIKALKNARGIPTLINQSVKSVD